MTTPNKLPTDPTGRLADLHDARCNPLLAKITPDGTAEPEAARAASRLAVVLGHWRLQGLSLRNLDTTLPGSLAVAAARHLAVELPDWADQAKQLGTDWDRTP